MIALPLALIWAGYTLTWWGYSIVKGKSVGLSDLVIPSHLAKVDAQFGSSLASTFANQATTQAAGSTTPPTGATTTLV